MAVDSLNIGLILLSLFCAGGLYAYLRDALRLQRLISSGTVTQATVLKKEKVTARSESIVLYLVTYEFVDERGQRTVHEHDVNSEPFFRSLSTGERMEIVYEWGSTGNSYPLRRLRTDRNVAGGICAGILVLWGGMGAFLL